jgi:hypothetical protein
MRVSSFLARFGAAAVVLVATTSALACPFCSVESQTLSEETESADAVALARLIKEAPEEAADGGFGAADPESGMATFEVIELLRGPESLKGVKEIKAVYFGESDRERVFLIMGLGSEKPDWTTPLPLSAEAVEYVRKLPSLPKSGADRLAFFQEYLENPDPLLAQDAYDEFARASYEDVQALGPRMHHDRLVKWIADLEINPSRRRLYLTMLGVCGSKADLPLLESMIVSDFDAMEPYLAPAVSSGLAMGGPPILPVWYEVLEQEERRKKLGLDALVACYLTLRGPEGLDLIDERFLKNPNTDFTHNYSTIMALRFHGDQETGVLPRERLLKSMRLLLDNPDFADQVILDLSRWEDWSVLDRLVEMYKASDKRAYVRPPIITYLTVASEQTNDVGSRAKAGIAELEQFDPEGVKQARGLMTFGILGRARDSGDAEASDDAVDRVAASDDTQAFAASEADDETDPADIPDPAEYDEDAARAASVTAARSSQQTKATPTAPPQAVQTSATPGVVSTSPPAPLLMIGVPLAAAALLMGVYWLILRVGVV